MKSVTLLVFTIVASFAACQELEFSKETKTINLSSNGIQVLTIDFSTYTELEEIDLSDNDLTAIESDVFKGNPGLTRIDLSGNRKLSFPMGMFLESTASFVNLSDCNIEEIPEGSLDGLPNLEVLDLTKNDIQFAESLGFESMKTPPKMFIVSKISQAELALVCKHIDTIFSVKEENREYKCKDIRKKSPVTSRASEPEKSYAKDQDVDTQIIEEQFIKGDTHMEMMSDDPTPMEGSGDAAEEVDESKIDANLDNKNVAKSEEGIVTNEETLKNPEEATDKVLEENEKPAAHEDKKPAAPEDEKLAAPEEDVKQPPLQSPKDLPEIDVRIEEPDEEEVTEKVKIATEEDELVHEETVPEQSFPPLVHQTEHKHDEVPKEDGEGKAKIEDVIAVVSMDKGRSNMAPTKNEEMVIGPKSRAADSTNDPTAEKAEAKTGSGSSIVLVMIIGVVVVGSAIVGYKYYKDRKPSYAVVASPTEGKELKEIKVEKANNEPQCERIPLMEQKVPEIEFKEIEEQPDSKEVTAKEAIGGENKADIPNIDDDVKSEEG